MQASSWAPGGAIMMGASLLARGLESDCFSALLLTVTGDGVAGKLNNATVFCY